MTVNRYHPILVVLHWLLAIMIGFQLGFGYFTIGKLANSDPAKLQPLSLHMGLGTAIIVLMAMRLITRYFTLHPDPSASQRRGVGRHSRSAGHQRRRRAVPFDAQLRRRHPAEPTGLGAAVWR